MSRLIEMLSTQPSNALAENPRNMLNLTEKTGAIVLSFLRLDCFRLLDLVIERCKARFRRRMGKQLDLTSFDVGLCRRFTMLAWPAGAFSVPHVDRKGPPWMRSLFGKKL